MIRALVALASFALTSALFGAASVNLTLSPGETVQIELWGTTDGQVSLVDTATNQVVADGGMLAYSPGFYSNGYWGYGNSYVSGVSFTIGSTSYITGLPAGNYRLEVSSSGCTGWSSGSNPYYLTDWSSWDTMDYTVTVY